MKFKIKKFYDDAIIPKYQTDGAAGFDFCAHLDTSLVIPPQGIADIGTGVGIEIADGYELQVRNRSGLPFKYHVSLLNGIGTIDSDFRGEIRVILKNFSDEDFVVEPGMRIAQGVVAKYEHIDWEEAEDLSQTERNQNAFGSTGLK